MSCAAGCARQSMNRASFSARKGERFDKYANGEADLLVHFFGCGERGFAVSVLTWSVGSHAMLQVEAAGANLDPSGSHHAHRGKPRATGPRLVDAERWVQLSAGAGYTRAALSEHSPWALLGAPTSASSTWLPASWLGTGSAGPLALTHLSQLTDVKLAKCLI